MTTRAVRTIAELVLALRRLVEGHSRRADLRCALEGIRVLVEEDAANIELVTEALRAMGDDMDEETLDACFEAVFRTRRHMQNALCRGERALATFGR